MTRCQLITIFEDCRINKNSGTVVPFKCTHRTEFFGYSAIRPIYKPVIKKVYSHTLKSYYCDANFEWIDRTEFIREMTMMSVIHPVCRLLVKLK